MIRVSVIVPTNNEERYIAACLESVLSQGFPAEEFEVLVVDGGRTDRTRAIVRSVIGRVPVVRLLENPKRIAAAAINVGLKNARGEFVMVLGAHATYDPAYVKGCVALLERGAAENVGGVQRAVGTRYVSRVIALAMSHPLGVGDAHFRFSDQERYVDSVFGGAWRRETLERLGGFSEEWAINEDYEFNYRLRQAGGRILLSPAIRLKYYPRRSFAELSRQYFRYGLWKVKTLVTYPGSVRWRQLVPPALVLGLIASGAILPVSSFVGAVVPVVYLLALLGASAAIAVRRDPWCAPALPVAFVFLHVSWGVGFLAGIARFGFPRLSWRGFVRGLTGNVGVPEQK